MAWIIDNLPKRMYPKVQELFKEGNLKQIGKIFLEHGVTHCDTCANNLKSIKEWMTYWVSTNYFKK